MYSGKESRRRICRISTPSDALYVVLGTHFVRSQNLAICAKESRWTGGELQVDSVMHVASIIRRTQCFKPNGTFVIIDFLSRHGYISPESFGYLDLLQSLRSGDCTFFFFEKHIIATVVNRLSLLGTM